MSRVPHVMYGAIRFLDLAVAPLRICMKPSKIRYPKAKAYVQCLDFAIQVAINLLLTCSRVAAGERTFLPLRPRKSGHAALSGAV